MERELYKQIDIDAIKNAKCLIDDDTELGAKCWRWAEKKALANYIEERRQNEI